MSNYIFNIFQFKKMTAWPSGLRRHVQVVVLIGVGSNPTAVRFSLLFRNSDNLSSLCYRNLYTNLFSHSLRIRSWAVPIGHHHHQFILHCYEIIVVHSKGLSNHHQYHFPSYQSHIHYHVMNKPDHPISQQSSLQ